MSITDELRESVKQTNWAMTSKAKWFAIADRIDIEHNKAIMKIGSTVANGYTALPKDADGVLIHIWDRMEHIELGYVLEVIAVGIDCFIAWNTHLNRYWQYDNKLFRHHREPTVEDVLDEFASAYDRIGGEDEEHQKYLDLIAEYAAKLQLKAQ